MANALADKLSDQELSAIIVMTSRLKESETACVKLTNDNETLQAKLTGVERVKDFLVHKIRELEVTLASSVEHQSKVAQQIASDQEVIHFLDGRVQDLELEARGLRGELKTAETKFSASQKSNHERVSLVSDMLNLERDKLAVQSSEWKAQKKLLVREVKQCRSQIVSLQAERDGYREQNEKLHGALNKPRSNGRARTMT